MLTCKHWLCANAAPTQIAFEKALRHVYVIERADRVTVPLAASSSDARPERPASPSGR